MLSVIRSLCAELILWSRAWRRLLWKLCVIPIGFGSLRQLSERVSGMSKMFTYNLGLLPVPAGVAKQRLVVKRGEEVIGDPVTVDAAATEVQFEAGPEGAEITLSLDYMDEAGNDSANLEMTFTVVDQVAPAAPEGFGDLTQVAEREVAE